MEDNKIKKFAESVYDINALGEKNSWDKDSYVGGFLYGYDAANAEFVELGGGFINMKKILRTQRIICEQEMRARLQSHYRAIPEQDISYVIINAPEPFESRQAETQVMRFLAESVEMLFKLTTELEMWQKQESFEDTKIRMKSSDNLRIEGNKLLLEIKKYCDKQ